MDKLKNREDDLPEGWKFLVEETGWTVDGETFNQLVRNVWYHMKINDIDVPKNLPEIIEHELCKTAPDKMLRKG